MRDHPLTQAALLILIVSAGIVLEKWLVTVLPSNGVTDPIKKLVSLI